MSYFCPKDGARVPNWMPRHFPCKADMKYYILIIALLIIGFLCLSFLSAGIFTRPNISAQTNNNPVVIPPVYEESTQTFEPPPTQTSRPTSTNKPTMVSIVKTKTPTSINSGGIKPEIPSCPGAPKAQLELNEDAEVCTKKDNVFMRSGPGKNNDVVTKLIPQSVVWVLDGPICADRAYWWKVRTNTDIVGWMMEGGDKKDPYYLCPN